MQCSIIPPYILEHLAQHAEEQRQREAALETIRATKLHRSLRVEAAAARVTPKAQATSEAVYDCGHQSSIGGAKLIRKDGHKSADITVNEAYDGLTATLSFYASAFKRKSVDGNNMGLNAYVHYGSGYDNAFWDGTEMIFGDGDGISFNRFTIAVDVIGHELTHGVQQYESNLEYQGQSGALNESLADVFGSMVKQFTLKQTAAEADWLIGAGLMTKKGQALRSMKAPGTAYDDHALGGRDPQPDHMADYSEIEDDNGGVHLFSGIPNKAFYLAAVGIGGTSWEGAGRIWYDAMCDNKLAARATFADFASLTVALAGKRYGAGSTQSQVVREAWQTVGVLAEDVVSQAS